MLLESRAAARDDPVEVRGRPPFRERFEAFRGAFSLRTRVHRDEGLLAFEPDRELNHDSKTAKGVVVTNCCLEEQGT